ncbi:RidA family protein [Ferrovibrio sp.]|uniref:RidA family protein n=1 Tax=Ferrovibrio sp. TaxID=1917215 RepID=UPI0035B06B51
MTKKTKEIIPVIGLAKPRGVWSVVTKALPGQLIFVSGLLSKDEAGEIVGAGDITAQTEQVLKNLVTALASADATLEDIVRVDVYVRDIKQFDKIHAVRAKYFLKDPPASTMVEVSGMTDERCLIEINAIAVIP